MNILFSSNQQLAIAANSVPVMNNKNLTPELVLDSFDSGAANAEDNTKGEQADKLKPFLAALSTFLNLNNEKELIIQNQMKAFDTDERILIEDTDFVNEDVSTSKDVWLYGTLKGSIKAAGNVAIWNPDYDGRCNIPLIESGADVKVWHKIKTIGHIFAKGDVTLRDRSAVESIAALGDVKLIYCSSAKRITSAGRVEIESVGDGFDDYATEEVTLTGKNAIIYLGASHSLKESITFTQPNGRIILSDDLKARYQHMTGSITVNGEDARVLSITEFAAEATAEDSSMSEADKVFAKKLANTQESWNQRSGFML